MTKKREKETESIAVRENMSVCVRALVPVKECECVCACMCVREGVEEKGNEPRDGAATEGAGEGNQIREREKCMRVGEFEESLCVRARVREERVLVGSGIPFCRTCRRCRFVPRSHSSRKIRAGEGGGIFFRPKTSKVSLSPPSSSPRPLTQVPSTLLLAINFTNIDL